MRRPRILRALIGLTAFSVLLCVISDVVRAASRNSWIEEPIFGLYYFPDQAHFGRLSTSRLLPACKLELSEINPLPPALTLYAQYVTASQRIYIAGTPDNLGIYLIRHGTCVANIPNITMLQRHHSPPLRIDQPILSDTEVKGLFGDALARYSKAFGGKTQFFHWLDTLTAKMRSGCKGQPELSCPFTYHDFQSWLQKSLQDYRGS